MFTILMLLACLVLVHGQTSVSGNILDEKGIPIPGANIYFEGTFEGCTSDSTGYFSLSTKLSGEQTLLVSFMGYEQHSRSLLLNQQPVNLDIVLEELRTDLGEVTITVGTFAAGDEGKSAVLSTLDLATASGSFGDMIGAISSLPGTSHAGEEGGLMVRGGERYETATLIDGMGADDAFTAKLPNVPVRGRFSPMLFRGTVFSTGGYSAEYGQALSSVLLLNSTAMPKKEETSITAHSSGLHVSHGRKWDRTSLSSHTGYNNMGFLYSILNSNIKWQKAPVGLSENLVFRKKTGRHGLLKAMAAYGYDRSGMFYPTLNPEGEVLYELENHNVYGTATYKDQLGQQWILHSGLTFGCDYRHLGISDTARLIRSKKTSEVKFSLTGPVIEKVRLNVGGNLFLKSLNQEYRRLREDNPYISDFLSPIFALYSELDVDLSRRFSLRLGVRAEALTLTEEHYLSPRFALAAKLTKYSQLSLGYGHFSQQAQEDYLIYNQALRSERAEHLIANFQYIKGNRIFRIEAYAKQYDRLVKYAFSHVVDPGAYNNRGEGYARGIDLFFRDSQSIPNGDFWLSYSLMDSERNYRDYTHAQIPSFISLHTLSLAYKQYVEAADSYFSIGYNFSSGRPYVDPNISLELQQRTGSCQDLGFSIFHFTELFGKFAMLFAQVSNVLGTENVYGYRFARTPDGSGMYRSEAILPVSKRFFLLGIHLSFTGQTDI